MVPQVALDVPYDAVVISFSLVTAAIAALEAPLLCLALARCGGGDLGWPANLTVLCGVGDLMGAEAACLAVVCGFPTVEWLSSDRADGAISSARAHSVTDVIIRELCFMHPP
jgi:hypothetical protein